MKIGHIIKGTGWTFLVGAAFFLALSAQAGERQWVNPKEAIGPELARLPKWKKALTELENEEI